MTRAEFKQKYFVDSFYWVNEGNYQKLQEIGIEFDCVNVVGNKSLIHWHDEFKNIGFRTYERNKGKTTFQREDFLTENEIAINYEEMINDYNDLNQKKMSRKIISITEAFSMQPRPIGIYEQRLHGDTKPSSIACFKQEDRQDGNNINNAIIVGYNFEGKKVCEYLRASVNIHFKTE